ncbi:uncharacterized protein LOC141589709 [Silene latifolia]|uniref:uncharacterized protein LOC141589709 n=1 Tax=Silene latifolia TaxID=37657 RepID=UPI003D78166B
MLALLAGLERARIYQVAKLLVHMDNATCVDLVLKDQLVSNSIRPLVVRCKELIRLPGWQVHIEHVFREANRASDWLANQGVNAPTEVTFLDEPPDDLRTILREDLLGVTTPRFIP